MKWQCAILARHSGSSVEEGVEVLEVPKIGCPITTDEVSVQTGDRGKCYIVSNKETREYMGTVRN